MDREQGDFTQRWNKFFKRQSSEDEQRQEKHLAMLLKAYSTPNPTLWEQIKFVLGAVVFWVIVLFIAWNAGLTELPSPLFYGWKKATLGLIGW